MAVKYWCTKCDYETSAKIAAEIHMALWGDRTHQMVDESNDD